MTRFHVLGVPGQPLEPENVACPFTAKAILFDRMMSARGHDVVLHPEPWQTVREASAPGEILCVTYGDTQRQVAEANPHLRAVEYAIGYGGVFTDWRVWESYAWMHTVIGERAEGGSHDAVGRFYDAVIPAFFDPEQFPAGPGGDYLLYVGRLTERKGVQIAAEVAKRLEVELVCAGVGDYRPEGPSYYGPVGAEVRAELMGGARALLAPTMYVEPFGRTAVEAQLCGTPVITTDWGAYPETVPEGLAGYRCHTLGEFCKAVELCDGLDRALIRERAQARYSLDAIGPHYDRYFDRLATLDGPGWYTDWTRWGSV